MPWTFLTALAMALQPQYYTEDEQVRLMLANKNLGDVKVLNVEYVLFDGTRVDVLTEKYAVEVDWAEKWAEGIGQCLWYAEVTKKTPCLVLLIKDRVAEKPFMYRAMILGKAHGIKLFFVDAYRK